MPSRATLLTGLRPQHTGVFGFTPSGRERPTLMTHLRPHGYRSVLLGKVDHSTPFRADNWDERIKAQALGAGREPSAYAATSRSVFDRSEPFFLNANSADAHSPYFHADRPIGPWPSRVFEPGELPLPVFCDDMPEAHQEHAMYASSVRRMDDAFGAVLGELEASGRQDDTIVVFLSDNGIALPFGKGRCYPFSTATPLLIRIPGVAPGDVAAPAQGVDLLPTLMDLLSLEPDPDTDGRSLVPFIEGAPPDHDRIHTQVDLLHADRRSPSRGLHTPTRSFVFNASIREYRNTSEKRTFDALAAAARTDPVHAARIEQYRKPPVFELFDTVADPGCRRNLAIHTDLTGWVAELREHMARVDDPMLAALDLADDPTNRQLVVDAYYDSVAP